MLPVIADEAAFDRIAGDTPRWQPVAEHLAARHSFAGALTRIEQGSAILFGQHERVLKLFPPIYRQSFEREHAILERLAGRLPLPTPHVVAQGDIEGWPYLWMTRLHGDLLDDRWPTLSAASRRRLARQVGEVTRRLHDVPHDGLPHVHAPYEYPDWPTFRRAMRARCVRYNAARGLVQPWLDELPRYLDSLDSELHGERDSLDNKPHGVPDSAARPAEEMAPRDMVLLHTELGPGHLLLEGEQLSGLLDFADAAVGDPEYDMAAVGLFVTRGDAPAFGAFLDGYGVPQSGRGPALVRRLMRHALLHRYGHLSFYLKVCPPPATTLAQAAQYWFGHPSI